jgi:hypothetical protein
VPRPQPGACRSLGSFRLLMASVEGEFQPRAEQPAGAPSSAPRASVSANRGGSGAAWGRLAPLVEVKDALCHGRDPRTTAIRP